MFAGRPEIHHGSDVNKVKVPVSEVFVSVESRAGVVQLYTVGAHKEHRRTDFAMIFLCRGRGPASFPGFPPLHSLQLVPHWAQIWDCKGS